MASFKRKQRPESEDEETGESALKKQRNDAVVSNGPVTKRFFGSASSGLFEIAGRRWKGTLLHDDRDLFVHTVRGPLIPATDGKKHYGETFAIQTARTDSQPLSKAVWMALIDYTFREVDDTRVINEDELDETILALAGLQLTSADRREAEDAFNDAKATALLSGQRSGRLEDFIKEQAETKTWAKFMMASKTVQTYLLCIDGGRLLQHYSLKTLDKLTIAKRRELLAKIQRDPYPLFFEDMYHDVFPGLPEIKIKSLDPEQRVALGREKLLCIWLYRSVHEAIMASKNTYVDLQYSSGGTRVTVHMPSSANGAMRSVSEDMRAQTQGTALDGTEPNFSSFDWKPALDQLVRQGSLQLLTNNRVQTTRAWRKTVQLVEVICELRKRGRDEKDTAMENADEDEKDATSEDGKDEATALRSGQATALRSGQRERERPLCDEQKAGYEMAKNEPVCLLMGIGGSGKTEVLTRLPGCSQTVVDNVDEVWPEIKAHPDDYFGEGPIKTIDGEKRYARYHRRAQKIVLAPTGKAAQVCDKRGLTAFTAHRMLFWLARQPYKIQLAFCRVVYLIMEEMSMFDLWLLSDTLYGCVFAMPTLRHLVLTGDHRQLAPVGGPGQPLLALMNVSWLPKIQLCINHRTSAASQLITENGRLVSGASQARTRFVHARKKTEGKVKGLRFQDGIFEIKAGRDIDLAAIQRSYKDRPMDLQILTTKNDERHIINGLCLKALGYARVDAFEDTQPWSKDYAVLQPGVRIVFRKNVLFGDTQARVCNGELDIVGDIFDVDEGGNRTEVKDEREDLVEGSVRRMRCQNSGKIIPIRRDTRQMIEIVYAATNHTMQGDQTKHCILVDYSADCEEKLFDRLSRQAEYVALSRAVERFTYVAAHAQSQQEAMDFFMAAMRRPEREALSTIGEYLAKPDELPMMQLTCVDCKKSFYAKACSKNMSRICDACLNLMNE